MTQEKLNEMVALMVVIKHYQEQLAMLDAGDNFKGFNILTMNSTSHISEEVEGLVTIQVRMILEKKLAELSVKFEMM